MEALLVSTGVVALAEIGDKTQLLALVLAIRFKKPIIVMLGILSATILNHGLATFLGGWLASLVSETTLHISLSIIFFAFALLIVSNFACISPTSDAGKIFEIAPSIFAKTGLLERVSSIDVITSADVAMITL